MGKEKKDLCKRCGRCCHFKINGNIQRCRHLIILSDGLTKCRIYKKRNGAMIIRNPFRKCTTRDKNSHDFKDCPYNTNKPLLKVYEGD